VPFQFEVLRQDAASSARFGRLTTAHGVVETPTFMPVGTQGTVKTVSPGELREIGAGVVLGNTYHLYLRPGREVIRQAGGLASFMGWHGPTLTDSGGFQLFSISDLSRVTRDGVTFNSHLDGSLHFFSPEKVVEVGFDIGPDVMMVLDECTRYPVTMDEARRSMDLTLDWAARARARYLELREERTEAEGEAFHPVPFAIVQGSTYAELRHACAERLVGLDFPGFAIGGLGVGEPASARAEMTELTASLLPRDKPRYLMGVGYPEDLFESVASGVDLFDCVLPTRNARTGWLFTSRGRLVVKNAAYARDFRPPDPGCDCLACRTVSRAYLRHLFNAGEMLAPRMASIHNLRFYLRLMAGMREAIARGEFQRFRADFLARYGNSRREVED
jgi:queuine tRNA-ribosyltransferase